MPQIVPGRVLQPADPSRYEWCNGVTRNANNRFKAHAAYLSDRCGSMVGGHFNQELTNLGNPKQALRAGLPRMLIINCCRLQAA